MRIWFAFAALLAVFGAAVAQQCQFSAPDAIAQANAYLAANGGTGAAGIFNMLFSGASAKVMLDGDAYYYRYAGGVISEIGQGQTGYDVKLTRCTVEEIAYGKTSVQRELKSGKIEVRANGLWESVALGVAQMFI